MTERFEEWKKEKMKQSAIQAFETKRVNRFLNLVKSVLFPQILLEEEEHHSFLKRLEMIQKELMLLLKQTEKLAGVCLDKPAVTKNFMEALPQIEEDLKLDLKAIFDQDPAAHNQEEIILCYPGFFAIFIYRVAHVLVLNNVPLLPRILSEQAHSQTGIDIHPAARIGKRFCIDHGTGIVIGETTVIGNDVKIYQGVTLGALSLSKGQELKGTKRHPTIEDRVTIYSGASVFGGNTTIGFNTTIGSSTFIVESVGPNRIVTTKEQRLKKV